MREIFLCALRSFRIIKIHAENEGVQCECVSRVRVTCEHYNLMQSSFCLHLLLAYVNYYMQLAPSTMTKTYRASTSRDTTETRR